MILPKILKFKVLTWNLINFPYSAWRDKSDLKSKLCCFKQDNYLLSSLLLYVSEPAQMHFKKLKVTVTEDKVKSLNIISVKVEVLWMYMGCEHIYIIQS